MMRAIVALCVAVWGATAAAAPLDDLTAALRLDELAVLMHDEGVADAEALVSDNVAVRSRADSLAQIAQLYDPTRIAVELRAALAERLDPAQQAEAAAYFASPAGAELVALELVARAAVADPTIEAAVRADWTARQRDPDAKIGLLKAFAEVNDLVDRNTTSTMTARFHFLRGVAQASGQPVDEAQILTSISARADRIRTDTEGWLMGYLLLAYDAAGTEDLRAYVAFSDSRTGRAVNAALFAGFEVAYDRISYGLGLIAGQVAMGQDL